jgi:methionyl-tRNA formyltransferase
MALPKRGGQLRAIVLTSTSPRHHFLVHTVSRRFDVVGVWREAKQSRPLAAAPSEADRKVLAAHFSARDASERMYFGSDATLRIERSVILRDVAPGGCNNPGEFALMRGLAPEVVLVFGIGVLRADVLAAFDGRLINLHLGLSPYYRGSGTNVWPLVNREPEYVGATIHYIDSGIDSGSIIAHVRPMIRLGDGPHDLGHRTILAAVTILAEVAVAHGRQPLPATPQDSSCGRLYRRREFNADAVRRMVANFADGMIDEYLSLREARDGRLSLVTPGLEASPLQPREL